MKVLVAIPDHQMPAIQLLSENSKLSRAEIIRRAIAAYLEQHLANAHGVFGLRQTEMEDGAVYQVQMRA